MGWAIVAFCRVDDDIRELGVISGVLGPGSTVPQGESHALQVLLDRVPGDSLIVTGDCKPAIRQAESSVYRPVMFPSWHSSAEERGRLSVTWVRSHGSDQDFCAEFGSQNLYRKRANDAADRLCRARATEAFPEGHQDLSSRLDGIHQEVCDILGRRAWILLSSEDRPPLDAVTPFCKPGRKPAHTSPATKPPRPPPS